MTYFFFKPSISNWDVGTVLNNTVDKWIFVLSGGIIYKLCNLAVVKGLRLFASMIQVLLLLLVHQWGICQEAGSRNDTLKRGSCPLLVWRIKVWMIDLKPCNITQQYWLCCYCSTMIGNRYCCSIAYCFSIVILPQAKQLFAYIS